MSGFAVAFGEFMEEMKSCLQDVRNLKSVNVNKESLRRTCHALVQRYFREIRNSLTSSGLDPSALVKMDSAHQEILRLSHGNNAKKSYLAHLSTVLTGLQAAEVFLLRSRNFFDTPLEAKADLSEVEINIMNTLGNFLPSSALSYRQALMDLKQPDRLSYRGTANEMREALRDVLDHMAPDKEVKQQSGFSFEIGQVTPTMKQKVRYILRARDMDKKKRETPEKSVELIEDKIAALTRATYNRASGSAHIGHAVDEVKKIKLYVDAILAEILSLSAESHENAV